MRFDDRAADGQAHAGAVRLGGEEGIEDLGRLLRGQSDAGIADRDQQLTIPGSFRSDDQFTFPARVLDRVDRIVFRTPGTVAALLGRPWLTFVAWTLGGAVGFLGALIFAELSTRYPQAGGKYVYAREAFGRRVAFAIGWIEALGTYCAAIAAIGVVCGEYLARLCGWPGNGARLGAGLV
ncbi:MAG: amino acid permease, partial [Deltaproteobacteria bacterium]